MLSDKGLEKFTHLQKAYRASFKDKRNTLLEAWHTVESSSWDRNATDDLRQFTHRLAGSAALYGYEAISRYATELEGLLLSHDDRSTKDGPNAWLNTEITQCIVRLIKELESEVSITLQQ